VNDTAPDQTPRCPILPDERPEPKDHVYMHDALDVNPPIPEAEIHRHLAAGTLVEVPNTDPRGEPGYLARHPNALVGLFVHNHPADDGTTANAACEIAADPELIEANDDRDLATVLAEIAQLVADFRATDDGLVRLYSGVIAYEFNTALGRDEHGIAHHETTIDKVIVIRDGRPLALDGKEWEATRT
jgi:hypothetical protein